MNDNGLSYLKWLILIFAVVVLFFVIANFNTINFILAPIKIKLYAKLVEIKDLIALYREQLPDF